MTKTFFTLLIFLVVATSVNGQNSILDVGVRFQKAVNLYYENGVSVNYSNKKLRADRLYFGFSYVTSRLGTALNSNAIKQDNYLLSSAYYFRKDHAFRPFLRLNAGYFSADYEEAVFDVLPGKSPLLSTDAGLSFKTQMPLKIATSLGYNFITGDGMDGPGTLYPVFYQITLSWDVFHKRKPL